MRNLKRALSLTLASVMLLGMMVVGSSAAGYPDVSEEENIEAIEVLQAVGVMGGDENGNFNPDDYVTREQMAVIMAQLLKLDYNYYKGTNPFSDVPEWAAPYVAACAANGVTAGIGGGLYGSKQNIQAVQAALMMLKALGYFQYPGDYGDSYILATVKQGTEIGLFEGIDSNADSPLTRNQVAQMALNALQADMVSFTGDPGIEYTGTNGEKWVGGYRAEYTPRTSTQAKYQAIERRSSDVASDLNHKGQYYIQLGEELYDGDLRLYSETTDDFKRPARTWEYDGKEIGTYVKKELLKAEYTEKVTGKTLYDLLGKDTIAKYDFLIAVDGEVEKDVLNANSNGDSYYFNEKNLIRSNTEGVGGTGKGVLTQVYVDPNEEPNGAVYIAIINTYLAKANKDYDSKNDEVELVVYAAEEVTPVIDGSTVKALVKNSDRGDKESEKRDISGEDFDIESVKKGDFFLVNVAENEVKVLSDVETVSGTTISLFKNKEYVTAEGTQYDYASAALYDWDVLDQYVKDNMKDTTYNLFLDHYGYMIGIEIVEETTNYLFLAGIDMKTSNLSKKTAEGNVVFLDGTMDTIEIDMGKSTVVNDATGMGGLADPTPGTTTNPWIKNMGAEACATMNTWCTYSVGDNGVYTLTEVANTAYSLQHAANKKNLGQSRVTTSNPGTDAAADIADPFGTVDKKHTATDGIASGTNFASKYRTVYGNDKSIYLVAVLDEIEATAPYKGALSSGKAIIVSDVDATITGVQNADLKLWNAKKAVASDISFTATPADTNNPVSYGAYTLFDKNGYVIASVVVGEDGGSTNGYVYVISDDMDSEGWNEATKKWEWTREVVVDGEVKKIKETSDNSSSTVEIDSTNMLLGHWYEVKYKSDGTVKSATPIDWDADHNDTVDGTNTYEFFCDDDTSTNKFVGLVKKVETSLRDPAISTVVLCQNLTGANNSNWDFAYAVDPKGRFNDNIAASGIKGLHAEGNTLYIDTDTTTSEGFAVSSNAKIVLVQDKQVTSGSTAKAPKVMVNVKTYTNDKDGKGLEDMLDDLNKNNRFVGFVSAVFDNGPATTVIVWDQTPETVNTGDNTQVTPGTPGTTESNAAITELGNKLAVSYTDSDYLTPIDKAFKDAGYTVVSWGNVDHPVANGQKMTASKDGVTKEFTINSVTHFSTIYVNNQAKVYQDGTTVAVATGVPSNANNYVKTASGHAAGALDAASLTMVATSGTITAGMNYGTVGYVKEGTAGTDSISGFTAGTLTVASGTDGKYTGADTNTYYPIGAVYKMVITADADVKTTASWTSITTPMAVESATGSTVTYGGDIDTGLWPASATTKLTMDGSKLTLDGSAQEVLVAGNETFTVTFPAIAAGADWDRPAITVTPAAGTP